VLFVTPECAPWVKTGGLGDVSGALPQALAELGHDVRVMMPAYPQVRELVDRAASAYELPARWPWPAARLLTVASGKAFQLGLLDCPPLYGRAGGPYDDTQGDNALRFAMFCDVAAGLAADGSPWRPDILHCHDWPAALAPALLRRHDPTRRTRSVMTIHNLAFQGLFPMSVAQQLALPPEWLTPQGVEFWGKVSFLKAGIRFADAVTTVSPTYAREIQQEPLGCGFDGILRDHAVRLHGILNGVDTAVWNPATDPHLAQRYDARLLHLKVQNKQALQQRMGLQVASAPMLFGTVGRLTHQKGIDLILDNVPWLVGQGDQLAVLGSGDAALEQRLSELARAHPGQVAVRIGFDEPMAHLIEGGADAYLMPSRFEPCGLNQMYSLLYGTPPIVRATGGLADTVVDLAAGDDATGIVFDAPSAEALRLAMARALDARGQAARWRRLQVTGMSQRFDWRVAAERYVGLYRELLGQARP
jgi:starch synthase